MQFSIFVYASLLLGSTIQWVVVAEEEAPCVPWDADRVKIARARAETDDRCKEGGTCGGDCKIYHWLICDDRDGLEYMESVCPNPSAQRQGVDGGKEGGSKGAQYKEVGKGVGGKGTGNEGVQFKEGAKGVAGKGGGGGKGVDSKGVAGKGTGAQKGGVKGVGGKGVGGKGVGGKGVGGKGVNFKGVGGTGTGGGEGTGVGAQASDLEVRFSKFEFVDDVEPFKLPLQASAYPMEDPLAESIRLTTNAAFVMTGDDPTLTGVNVEAYIANIGGAPTYPDQDPDHTFWQDFREVVYDQILRADNNAIASDFVLPDLWAELGMDASDVAEAVHDEDPGYWQARLIESLVSQGVTADPNIFQFGSIDGFIEGIIGSTELNTWATAVVSQISYRIKWYFGRPRPEEVAYAIYDGTIPQSAVPTDIYDTIQGMTMTDTTDFTAYPEGSPLHPSFPAMHAAASSASFWMSVVMNLTKDQYCQALRTDYAVSFARTVAGVNYPTDNIAGLNLGQEILADRLVDLLVDSYAADRSAAQTKVDAMRFDWANFNPVTCTVDGNSANPNL